MQVRNDLQGRGIGRLTLDYFAELISKRNIQRIYCMLFAHLESFYGLIGFKKIEAEDAPAFLRNRIAEFHKNHRDEHVILMAR
jgi:N-acetylglutamate synthase-like GNAT family acetyltransferase